MEKENKSHNITDDIWEYIKYEFEFCIKERGDEKINIQIKF